MNWKIKIKTIEKAEKGNVVAGYDILLNGELFLDSTIKLDVGDYGLFTSEYLTKQLTDAILNKSWSEISKEVVFRKMKKKIGEEIDVNSTDLSGD